MQKGVSLGCLAMRWTREILCVEIGGSVLCIYIKRIGPGMQANDGQSKGSAEKATQRCI